VSQGGVRHVVKKALAAYNCRQSGLWVAAAVGSALIVDIEMGVFLLASKRLTLRASVQATKYFSITVRVRFCGTKRTELLHA